MKFFASPRTVYSSKERSERGKDISTGSSPRKKCPENANGEAFHSEKTEKDLTIDPLKRKTKRVKEQRSGQMRRYGE